MILREESPPAERLRAFLEGARTWCRGRYPHARAILLLYLAYAGVRHLLAPEYWSWFGAITFGIHELGHVATGCAGHFVCSISGSVFQVIAPVAAGAVLWRQRDYFGLAVAGGWLAFSLFNLATYVGDARTQELVLVGLTEEPEHDWNYILSTLGLLPLDRVFAFLLRAVAFGTWAGSLAFGGWLCLHMRLRPEPRVG